jgi:hypothetical protein
LSQKKVQSAADMLWVAFIEFYWAWYAQELQVTTISASLFTSLRAWCGGVLLLLLFQPPNILDINYLLLVWFFFLLLFSKLWTRCFPLSCFSSLFWCDLIYY